MREELAERAIVRMDGAAASLRVVLDVDLRRAIGNKTGVRHHCEYRRRDLNDGDGGEQEAADEGTAAHAHQSNYELGRRNVTVGRMPTAVSP